MSASESNMHASLVKKACYIRGMNLFCVLIPCHKLSQFLSLFVVRCISQKPLLHTKKIADSLWSA